MRQLDSGEFEVSYPLRDQAVNYLERQIDRIKFAKLPKDIRADLLAILHLHQLVDVEFDGAVLVCKVRPHVLKIIDKAVAASALV